MTDVQMMQKLPLMYCLSEIIIEFNSKRRVSLINLKKINFGVILLIFSHLVNKKVNLRRRSNYIFIFFGQSCSRCIKRVSFPNMKESKCTLNNFLTWSENSLCCLWHLIVSCLCAWHKWKGLVFLVKPFVQMHFVCDHRGKWFLLC